METQAILAAWATKLQMSHPDSGSGKAIRAFLVNPNENNRRIVGLNADGGANHLAVETLNVLKKLGALSKERGSFVASLAALVK